MSYKPCPFCGECREIKLEFEEHETFGFGAFVMCCHCAARGTCYFEEVPSDAFREAVRAWNEAYRPHPFTLWVRRTYGTIRYRIGL